MTTCPRCGKEVDQPFHTCMKTKPPQEQAEEIDVKVDLCGGKYTYIRYKNGGQECLRYGEEWRNLTGDNLVYWLVVELLQARSAPLPELIAVAQAAEQYAGSVSECCMTGERTGEVCDLHCALEALRATRKVEL